MAALTDLIWEKCFLRVRVCNLPRRLRPAGSEHRFFFLFLPTSSAEHARTGPSGVVHARQRGTRATPKPASCLAATAPGSSRPICRTARRGRSPWSSPKPARSSGGGGGAAAARAPQHPLGDAVHSVGSREWRLRRAEAALEAHLDDEDIFGEHTAVGARGYEGRVRPVARATIFLASFLGARRACLAEPRGLAAKRADCSDRPVTGGTP